MRNSRLGCFTFSGIMAALITALVIGIAAFTQGGVMYSPGALNAQPGARLGGVTSHAETGGNCKACHVAPWETQTMADRCIVCHVDVAAQMRQVASLHGAMKGRNPNMNCFPCHPDHRGAQAPLTVADMADFPHESLGYSLNGHRLKVPGEAFACRDCHTDGVAAFHTAACSDCHRQMDAAFTAAHETDWGGDCLSCHDGVDTYGDDFDHNRFAFPLAGRHMDVSCRDCHANARTIADLQAAPQDCAACHADPPFHAGLFGTDCVSCHTATAWRPASFNGRHTFPLDHGEGGTVSCAVCHPSGYTTYTCYGCHEHDEAEVRSKHLEEGIPDFQNCMECHPAGNKDEGGGRDDDD